MVSVAYLTSLLKQSLRNASGEGLFNRPVIFVQTPITAQPKERMSEHSQKPQHNPTFMQSTTPTPVVIDVFANESYKTKSFDQDKMKAMKDRI